MKKLLYGGEQRDMPVHQEGYCLHWARIL